jgi:two-component system alkaline phosphatase synthesis response regulator PhoP
MNNKKILVVDDEPHLIRSLTFVLAKEGYDLSIASDGEEAIEKIFANKPELVFLDIMMPKKNGYEVCEIIRSQDSLKDIYIIMLSAKGWEIDRVKATNVGANEFMSKPFSPLEVVSRVRRAFATKATPVGAGN